jgi:hypothetical protein
VTIGWKFAMGVDLPLPRRDEAMLNRNWNWGGFVEVVENCYRDRFVCPLFPTPLFPSVNNKSTKIACSETFFLLYFTNAPRY